MFTRFAATAATTAIVSSAVNDVSAGSRVAIHSPIGPFATPATTTPRIRTNPQNHTSIEYTIRPRLVRPSRRATTPSTIAPAAATHAGATPTKPDTANPRSVAAMIDSATTGAGGSRFGSGSASGRTR
ncbi:hypothetical protein AZG88_43580 [Rhodococcus sp. LB1]|nr:hypothetical protein AZG88_43580 [Rhodococcus sp. LB1]